jgi:hypothetical protein
MTTTDCERKMAKKSDFVEVKSPLANLTREQQSQALASIGEEAKRTFEDTNKPSRHERTLRP